MPQSSGPFSLCLSLSLSPALRSPPNFAFPAPLGLRTVLHLLPPSVRLLAFPLESLCSISPVSDRYGRLVSDSIDSRRAGGVSE